MGLFGTDCTQNKMDPSLELKKSWVNEKSGIYLNKNWRDIQSFMETRGITLSENEIKRFLNLQKTSEINYKNYGKQKIAELGKSFLQREKFFANLHADCMVLSKARKYGTKNSLILIVIDQLSRWMFLRSCYTTKFRYLKKAWDDIFERLKEMGYESSVEVIFHDGGPDFENVNFKTYIQQKNIRNNLIRRRPYRLSKNSPYAESAIRRCRIHLEENMKMKKKGDDFNAILRRTERQCNNETLTSIGMSASEALRHEPQYMMLLSESKKLKKRKYLRKELVDQKELPLGSVVRIKKFLDKEFKSTAKESYGHLSRLLVVKETVKDREIWTYKVADIFTLECISGSFSCAELKCVNLSYVEACEKESLNVRKIIGTENGIIQYQTEYNDVKFCANESLVSDVN